MNRILRQIRFSLPFALDRASYFEEVRYIGTVVSRTELIDQLNDSLRNEDPTFDFKNLIIRTVESEGEPVLNKKKKSDQLKEVRKKIAESTATLVNIKMNINTGENPIIDLVNIALGGHEGKAGYDVFRSSKQDQLIAQMAIPMVAAKIAIYFHLHNLCVTKKADVEELEGMQTKLYYVNEALAGALYASWGSELLKDIRAQAESNAQNVDKSYRADLPHDAIQLQEQVDQCRASFINFNADQFNFNLASFSNLYSRLHGRLTTR